ncbi:MAG TPA: ABC transporter permease [Anaerolineales bacterium]|nr:ABC transporter permease [Anaerolineales bacterium]
MQAIGDFLSGLWRESVKTLKILSRNKMGLFGFILIVLIVLLSFVGPFIWPPETSANVTEINQGASAQHWLGTDFQGQDNLRKIINGGKDIVLIAVITGVLSMLIAVVVGSFSAFVGGWVDSLLMELVNIWLTIPKFPLLAVLATVLALKDVVTLSVLMAVLEWPALARQVRSQVLSLKNRDYVEAAVMLDLGTPRIIFRELLPNMMSFVAISTIFAMTHAIYQQTGLVFLGIVPYSSANWGVMISAAERRGVLFNPQAAWSILAPMAAIVIFQLALVSFARSLDEVFNPRLRTSV